MKKRIILLTTGVMIIAILGAVIFQAIIRKPKWSPELPALAANTQLSPEQMKSDLDYLSDILLKTHPKTVNGFSDSQKEVISQAYKRINAPMTLSDFFFVANSIICTFNDPHTSAVDVEKDSMAIKAYFKWFDNGFYSIADSEELHKGDKLTAIGGIEVKSLLDRLGEVIPHENLYWLYFRAQDKLVLTPYLKYIGVDISKGDVGVTVERNGVPVKIQIPIINDKEWTKNRPHEEYISCSYKIDDEHNLGYMRIDDCTDNAAYKNALNGLFDQVAKRRIGNIVVDLRNNTGGNSWVANRFMQYLDIKQYNDFSSYIRFSALAKKQRGYPSDSGDEAAKPEIIKNEMISDKSLLFHGKIYILTSHKTFSSANMFAVYFKDNNLGTIVGEETGNSPDACGDIIMAQLPNSHIVFSVSHKIFYRPDTGNVNNSVY